MNLQGHRLKGIRCVKSAILGAFVLSASRKLNVGAFIIGKLRDSSFLMTNFVAIPRESVPARPSKETGGQKQRFLEFSSQHLRNSYHKQSHTVCRLVSVSMTLNDLGRPQVTVLAIYTIYRIGDAAV